MALASPADEHSIDRIAAPRLRRLGLVVGLPLVDGVFVTLVLAGILASPTGVVMTGLVIFGGSAAIAVVLADLVEDPERHLKGVLLLAAVVIPVAGIQAAIAPSVASNIETALLKRFAVLVLLVIAIELASERRPRWLPRPIVIVVLGLVASLQPAPSTQITIDLWLLVSGSLAAGMGMIVIVTLMLLGPRIHRRVAVSWLRYGGAGSLAILAVAIVSPLPEIAALAILGGAVIVSLFGAPARPWTDHPRWKPGIEGSSADRARAEETTTSA